MSLIPSQEILGDRRRNQPLSLSRSKVQSLKFIPDLRNTVITPKTVNTKASTATVGAKTVNARAKTVSGTTKTDNDDAKTVSGTAKTDNGDAKTDNVGA